MRSSLNHDIRIGHRWLLGLVLSVSVALPLLGLVSGCHGGSGKSNQSSQASETAGSAPKVVKPEKKDVRRTIERPGYNIEAFEQTPLFAKLPAYVQKLYVDIGDHVKADQLLVELSLPELKDELRQKEAAVVQGQAEIELAKAAFHAEEAAVATAEANVSAAEAGNIRADADYVHWQLQYARIGQLVSSNALDRKLEDETRASFKAAEAARGEVQAKVRSAKATLMQSQADVAKAKANEAVAIARRNNAEADLSRVKALLQYTQIRAPYAGVVTRRNINTGDFVQPSAGKEGWLLVVARVDPIRVFVNVSEIDAVWIRDGDVATIRPQSLQGQAFKGTVTRRSGALHPQNRTLLTEIDLPNGEGRLLPGMYVNVTIIAEHKNVWALPIKAVMIEKDQAFCYLWENGKPVRTALQLGMTGDDLVEVVRKSTSAAQSSGDDHWTDSTGQELVAADAASLSEGQPEKTATDVK